jgi:hypothetical protein
MYHHFAIFDRLYSTRRQARHTKEADDLCIFPGCLVYPYRMKSILQDLYRLQTLETRGVRSNRSEAEDLRAAIPQGLLTNYDRARARGKKGIAVVRNHVCTNCRMQVPVAVTASLKAGAVQSCGNCGLYLCLDPEEQAMPMAAPAASAEPAPRPKRKRAAAATQSA